jgi:group I intron endonuclease
MRKVISGIYEIRNIISNKKYIGGSIDIYTRWSSHKSYLFSNTHVNKYLQNAWNKYGEDAFGFRILEHSSKNKVTEREQWYLDNEVKYGFDYNIAKDTIAFMRGRKFSDEHKRKIGEASTGRIYSKETRKKMSDSAKAKIVSKETRRKQSKMQKGKGNAMWGRKHTEESKLKMSQALQGEGCGKSILTNETVLWMREIRETKGYSYQKIADMVGVYVNTARRAILGITWRHVK